MDTSKSVFQLHGVNAAEQPVLRKKLRMPVTRHGHDDRKEQPCQLRFNQVKPV
jgi:hypothetical protein